MPKKASAKYTVTAVINGKKYTGVGDTVTKALSSISIGNSKGRAIVTVSNGSAQKSRVLMPTYALRLFSSHGMMREIALKHVSSLFNGI